MIEDWIQDLIPQVAEIRDKLDRLEQDLPQLKYAVTLLERRVRTLESNNPKEAETQALGKQLKDLRDVIEPPIKK